MTYHFLFITNIPSPYRVTFWNMLGQQADVTVVFERRSASDRDANWQDVNSDNFEAIFCDGRAHGDESAVTVRPIKHIREFVKRAKLFGEDDKFNIIVCNATSPTGIMEIAYMRIHHISYWVEGDGAFVDEITGIKAKIKRFLYSKAVGCMSTCANHDTYYKAYGVDESRIHRYKFSSIVEGDSICKNSISKIEASKHNSYKILFVGQFIYRKGLDVLLEVARRFEKEKYINSTEVEFNLVGGNAIDESLMNDKCLPSNVKICGFKNQQELAEMYLGSDIFVLPTREDIWGLVVNEAMAKGLPIVTTDRCNAGLELVHEGKNGFIVPVGDADAMVNCLVEMINTDIESPGYLRELGGKSLEYIQDYTIENMVERHTQILK